MTPDSPVPPGGVRARLQCGCAMRSEKKQPTLCVFLPSVLGERHHPVQRIGRSVRVLLRLQELEQDEGELCTQRHFLITFIYSSFLISHLIIFCQMMEASLYDKIMDQQRLEPEFFRVGFYGKKFPFFLRVKMFPHALCVKNILAE